MPKGIPYSEKIYDVSMSDLRGGEMNCLTTVLYSSFRRNCECYVIRNVYISEVLTLWDCSHLEASIMC